MEIINLTWQPNFEAQLTKLEKRINGFQHNPRELATYAILKELKQQTGNGAPRPKRMRRTRQTLTAAEIVSIIRFDLKPLEGWNNFDGSSWLRVVKEAVKDLEAQKVA